MFKYASISLLTFIQVLLNGQVIPYSCYTLSTEMFHWLSQQGVKQKLANLKTDLDKKSTELNKFDSLVKSKEIELGKTNRLITNKEQAVQKKLEEYEKNKIELTELRTKYDDLRSNLEDKVIVLNKEIDRLNQDKEKLFQDLNEIKTKHSHCKESNAQSIESEIDHEKAVLQKLENQALNAKYETKIQYLEVEIDTLRSKIKKLLRENIKS